MGERRSYTWGAEVDDRGTTFRLFASKRRRVDLVLEDGRAVALDRDGRGRFVAHVPGVAAGARYRYRLDREERLLPDPASRYQPEGPHGPSEVVDPRRFRWTDGAWRGLELRGRVLYEMHLGTFSREGTYAAALRELPALRDLGVDLLELMPLAEFPGRFGWGYDGVDLYAPSHLYGTPDELRAFVDRAHALGLGVLLDVVYNHLGPSGNHLRELSDAFFTKRYANEWGDAIDFESDPMVRAFFVENAAYWIDELHFDGLRLDATQCVFDASRRHVLAEMAERARAAAPGRRVLLVAENEPQHARLVREPSEGGLGLDAIWNDDFHHSARVAATGRAEAYYSSHHGRPQELVSAAKWGALYQGQLYPWQDERRGTPALDLEAFRFVTYLENHDQVANSSRGDRLSRLTSPGRLRALTALLLLAPATPMLFQGQEFAASAPFLYFADHDPDLAELVQRGRRTFLEQFPSARDPSLATTATAPHDPRTFEACKLDHRERVTHAPVLRLHQDLLALRRADPTFAAQDRDSLHGAVLGDEAFALRFGAGTGRDRLLLVNLGPDLDLTTVAEPLLAPVEGAAWGELLSTEHPRYGGGGTPPRGALGARVAAGHSAVVLAPSELPDDERSTQRRAAP